MNAVRAAARELLGLFVEDWTFAIAIGVSIAIVAIASRLNLGDGAQRAIGLFACLALVVLTSVVRSARRK